MKIPEQINKIKEAFKGKYPIYLVGGCVRDHLLGITPKDYDIATPALPEQVMKTLDESNIRYIEKGISFGVVSAIVDGHEFEIATFRKDGNYSDGRRPDSVEFSNIEEDAKRRDFTINALYYDLNEDVVIDPTGLGLDDIKTKTVRFVGNMHDRVTEDKLRVLRYLRFCARFNSKVDSMIYFYNLSGISQERIHDEYIKGMKSSIVTNYVLFDNLSIPYHKDILGIERSIIYGKDVYSSIAGKYYVSSENPKKLSEYKFTNKEIRIIETLLLCFDIGKNIYDIKKAIQDEEVKEHVFRFVPQYVDELNIPMYRFCDINHEVDVKEITNTLKRMESARFGGLTR